MSTTTMAKQSKRIRRIFDCDRLTDRAIDIACALTGKSATALLVALFQRSHPKEMLLAQQALEEEDRQSGDTTGGKKK